MKRAYQVAAAMALDAALGDPRWVPHPVKLMGSLAGVAEPAARSLIENEYAAGAVAAGVVIGAAGAVSYAALRAAEWAHPLVGDAAAILMIYTCLAARDLADHSGAVCAALESGDIDGARKSAAMMVGRDTENLDESECARAAVESVAENTVDGVTAPLFYAVIGGPVAAMMYKATNTLDSTFGYKNERYMKFGFASAKLDDAANYIPARLTAGLVPFVAATLGMNAIGSARTLKRDGRKHPSPNSGLTEAAMAGALDIQLGGLNYYFGKPSEKPKLGDPVEKIEKKHIRRANKLMIATTVAAAALFIGAKMLGDKIGGGAK